MEFKVPDICLTHEKRVFPEKKSKILFWLETSKNDRSRGRGEIVSALVLNSM